MSDIIQPLLLDYMIEDMDSRFNHALVNLSGVLVRYPIYNTVISGRSVRKYVYLQESEAVGKQIIGASLVDAEGGTLANMPMSVIKSGQGFLIGFEFTVKLEVKTIV